jgi:hypothetical protein
MRIERRHNSISCAGLRCVEIGDMAKIGVVIIFHISIREIIKV